MPSPGFTGLARQRQKGRLAEIKTKHLKTKHTKAVKEGSSFPNRIKLGNPAPDVFLDLSRGPKVSPSRYSDSEIGVFLERLFLSLFRYHIGLQFWSVALQCEPFDR